MMSTKYRYGLYTLALHLVIAGLSYYIFRDQKWIFLLSEVIILLSLYVSFILYRRILHPIELMQTGINAIKDEDYNVKFLKTGSREINQLIDVFNQMLDKLGDERIRTQEQAYVLESLIEASPIGMIMLDYDDRIASINPSAKSIFKLNIIKRGDLIQEITHPLIAHLLQVPIGQSKVITTESISKYRCQTNTIIHRGFPRKFIMIEELSKELLSTERQAYGQVIRMMAHEVNNSMGAINSILQSVADFAFDDDDSEQKEYKDSLLIAINRNNDLAQFMKRFAEVVKVPPPHKRKISLNELVEHCLSVMSSTLSSHQITSDVVFTGTTHIQGDRVLLEQVLVNILKNSIEAIQQNGHITIHIQSNKPQLTVTDNGSGISPADATHLFTPFFSTKPTGQGVGLMLIREILVGHEAAFKLYTDTADGLTKFEIRFLA